MDALLRERARKAKGVAERGGGRRAGPDDPRAILPAKRLPQRPVRSPLRKLFVALIAGLCAGLRPRATLEIPSPTRRLDRILDLLSACRYSFHDLSRVQFSGASIQHAVRSGLAVATTAASAHQWFLLEHRFRVQRSRPHPRGGHPLGEPVIPNGSRSAKLHHAAFDANIIGGTPDLEVRCASTCCRRSTGRCSSTACRASGAGASTYRAGLERHHRGHFVLIDIRSERIYLADSPEGAYRKASAEREVGPFHLMRVGERAAYRSRRLTNGVDTRVTR
jgi:hypothetical protein